MPLKFFKMVQTQIDQLTKVQKDLLVNAAREKKACEIRTRGGATTCWRMRDCTRSFLVRGE
jgi:hypothetical protein